MNNKLDLLTESIESPLWTEFVVALAFCIFFSFVLKYVYRVSAHKIGLINYNSNILPILSITVFGDCYSETIVSFIVGIGWSAIDRSVSYSVKEQKT